MPWAPAIDARVAATYGTSPDAARLAELTSTGLSPSTAKTYAGHVDKYLAYCAVASVDWWHEASPLLWLTSKTQPGSGVRSPHTLSAYRSAVHHLFQAHGLPPPRSASQDFNLLKRGFAQSLADEGVVSDVDLRGPLPAQVALLALDAGLAVPLAFPLQALDGLRAVRALLFTAFGFTIMCRADTDAHMQDDDVVVHDNDAISVRLRVEKGHRQDLRHRPVRLEPACAGGRLAWLMRRYLDARNSLPDGPWRVLDAGSGASPTTCIWRLPGDGAWTSSSLACSTLLNDALAYLRVAVPAGESWSSHSLRIGAATAAYVIGLPVERIRQLGGWAPESKAVWRYIRPGVAPCDAAIAFFGHLRVPTVPTA